MKTVLLFGCVCLACASAAVSAQSQTNPATPNPTNPTGQSSGPVQTARVTDDESARSTAA